MNKVTTVNLNGNAFQLEESGYDALRAYLDHAAAKLAGNPDRDEIMSDIEQAIADKLRVVLGSYKTVATARQVETIIAEMGPVEAAGASAETTGDAKESGGAAATGAGATGEAPRSTAAGPGPKRLYRLHDGALLAGVCNGIAAYFKIDPTLVRVIFILLTLLSSGLWILAYLVMMFVIPAADTPAEKTAAYGATTTAQEFIRRAKEGYYEGMKAFPNREARREWRRKFKRDMRDWAHGFQWEMRTGAQRWQRNWQCGAVMQPGFAAGWSLMVPVLCVIHATLALGLLVALVSLLTSGAVLGVALPAGIPVWAGAILLLIAYSLVVLPIKLARHVYRHQLTYAMHPGAGAFVHLWEAVVWLSFVVVVAWLAFHHLPMVMDALHSIPPLAHDAFDAIRDWWQG